MTNLNELPQIRLRTLLKDDAMFKQWFMKVPTLNVVHSGMPWRLFVQQEKGGRWARVDLPTFAKAYSQVKLRLPDAWDMAVHCKPQAFGPPVVRINGKRKYNPCPPGHEWCGYCRRPTVFKYFNKHPNIQHINPEDRRCTICGSRLKGMAHFPTNLPWPLVTSP